MPACMLRNAIFNLPPNAAALLAPNPSKSKPDIGSGSDGGLTFAPRSGGCGEAQIGRERMNSNSALDGLRVLDFTTTIAGPHCARMRADLGAEGIKIEAPEGDMMRTRPPLRNGASTSFGQLNAGNKSLVLDLKTPHAVEVVRRLVATADVVVENFRP